MSLYANYEGVIVMLPGILEEMPPIEFAEAELDQPISLDDKGIIITVRQLIAARAPSEIREIFHIAAAIDSHIRPVGHLNYDDLKLLAKAVLEASDRERRVAGLGGGDFSTSQLRDEVERESPMGEKIIRSVRLNGLTVESAVERGKIKPKSAL
jgi:hypothetical protein